MTAENPIQFVEAGDGDATAGKMQVVAQVQEYIKNHLSEKLTLADVAAVFNFSPNYLSQLFGKYGDSGFVEYITETRIAAAKEMLEQGNLKVYEIAEKLGYESSFYFSKVFKKVTGSARGNTSKACKPLSHASRASSPDRGALGRPGRNHLTELGSPNDERQGLAVNHQEAL